MQTQYSVNNHINRCSTCCSFINGAAAHWSEAVPSRYFTRRRYARALHSPCLALYCSSSVQHLHVWAMYDILCVIILTEGDHEAGVHLIRHVLVRVALNTAVSPKSRLTDLFILVASERLEHLQRANTISPQSVTIHPQARRTIGLAFNLLPKLAVLKDGALLLRNYPM